MIILSDTFGLEQTVLFLTIAVIGFIVAYLIYRKDPSYALNRSFSLAILLLGLSYVFSFFGNLYYIVFESGQIFFIRTAFFIALVSFMFFYYTSLAINKGQNQMYSKLSMLIFSCLILINFVIIYVLNGVYFEAGTQTNSVSTMYFKIFNLGAIAVLYIVVYFYFFKSYFAVKDPHVKRNLLFFLIGWAIGGLGFLSIVGSDSYRILDLVGPFLIALSTVVISRSVLSRDETS